MDRYEILITANANDALEMDQRIMTRTSSSVPLIGRQNNARATVYLIVNNVWNTMQS